MKKSVILLCGPGCCPACPEVFENAVAPEAQQIEIRDDFTNTVKPDAEGKRTGGSGTSCAPATAAAAIAAAPAPARIQ